MHVYKEGARFDALDVDALLECKVVQGLTHTKNVKSFRVIYVF